VQASPVFFANTAKSLGLEETLRKKTIIAKAGEAGLAVAEAQAQYGVGQTTEIAHLKGRIESVRLLPSDPRSGTTFIVAISSKSSEALMSQRLVDALTSAEKADWREEMGFSKD
jgi:hypothetical protein